MLAIPTVADANPKRTTLFPHPEPVEGWGNDIHFASAMNFQVYIVECSDGSYYVGLARLGLERRVGEHNDGVFRGYTFSRRPVKLVWSEDFDRLTDAIACERRLKGWRREKKQALISGNYDALPGLARTVKTPRPSTSSG